MTVDIPIDKLVEIIVRQVLAELAKQGIRVGGSPGRQSPAGADPARVTIDMTGYRTPVLTEDRVRSLDPRVREILVPPGTVCTIGARDTLQRRKIKMIYTGTTP
jgi:hypothetical protein